MNDAEALAAINKALDDYLKAGSTVERVILEIAWITGKNTQWKREQAA